jgi:murein DD-endopeptidase
MYFSASAVPARGFQHRLHYTSLGRAETLVTAPMLVRTDVVGIQPPVRGGPWRAVNGPNDNTGHRRSITPYKGRVIVPQRFAIDFLRVDAEGKTYKGDPASNASYYAYGAETYAVAAATVSFVKDGVPENTPQSADRAVPMAWDTVSGNFVVLDLGSDRVAVYAHLQPGSIRVKAGERVTPAQLIGRIGNSGNSSEPHLHFHLCDTAAEIGLIGGDGIPFTFGQFTRDDGSVHRNEIPLRDWNVRF